MVLLDLVRQTADRFLCMYAASGLEFDENTTFVEETARQLNTKLIVSTPSEYKGSFFERLGVFRYWPTIVKRWCSRDLKFRPQKKRLGKICGKTTFYKLNGVRRTESSRRNIIYKATAKKGYMQTDYDVHGDVLVYPILDWSNEDIRNYLKINEIRVPTNPLYKQYGVSGCRWCPFYQRRIYERIMSYVPNLYDEFIEWECRLNQPSISGFQWLRDIKSEMTKGQIEPEGTMKLRDWL